MSGEDRDGGSSDMSNATPAGELRAVAVELAEGLVSRGLTLPETERIAALMVDQVRLRVMPERSRRR